jgi:hypothetical protein
MKQFLVLITALFFLNNAQAQKKSDKLTVNIEHGKVTINKKVVSNDWALKTFTTVLDTANRTKLAQNKVHTYDNLGILLFETAPQKIATGLISEFQILIDNVEPLNITPSNIYKGKIKIEKYNFTNTTTIEEIRTALQGYTEKASSEEVKYRFAKDGIYFYFLYNSNKKLCKITIGKEK